MRGDAEGKILHKLKVTWDAERGTIPEEAGMPRPGLPFRTLPDRSAGGPLRCSAFPETLNTVPDHCFPANAA